MIKFIKLDKTIIIKKNGCKLVCPEGDGAFCGSWCPFFEHRPKTPGYPESVVLKCRAQEITFCEGEEE